MTVETVRAFLSLHAPDIEILETDASTATVDMAARGHGVQPAQIAKTLSLRIKDRTLLIVASGGTAQQPQDQGRAGRQAAHADRRRGGDPDRPSGRRRLPVRPGDAPARLLRRFAQGVR